MSLYRLIRPVAFAFDAETAHGMTIAALKVMPVRRPPDFPASLRTTVAGLDFPTPVGLAAGFDKDAEVAEQMLSLGFGFVEVGTLTPRAQHGNPRPRLFRLRQDRAVINRLGFNNRGQPDAFARLIQCTHMHGLIGVGGIASAEDAWERIRAGASLVQLYTAMVYEGPHIGARIARGLAERVAAAGYRSVAEAVGSE